MDWLNYHHLLYFWTAARAGSIAAACAELRLAQPTISAQIHALERAFGVKLFQKSGRGLTLTEAGRAAYRYADDIFALGRELRESMAGRPVASVPRLTVGVADVLPKLVAYRLLWPALMVPEAVRLECVEASPTQLLTRLSLNELDLVLSDAPIDPHVKVRAFNHLLGESPVVVFGTSSLAARHRRGFPQSLDGAPFVLPTRGTILRRSLDRWFEQQRVRPAIVGEFEDSALLKVFGQAGMGLFVAPSVVAEDVQERYDVKVVGRLPDVRESYYAISAERTLRHPAVAAITRAARDRLFKADATRPKPGRSRRNPAP